MIGTGDRMETKDKVYSVLRSSWSAYGRAPTLHELKVRTGRDLPALRQALKDLRDDGLVQWKAGGGAESIRLTGKTPRDEFSEERSGRGGIQYWTDY